MPSHTDHHSVSHWRLKHLCVCRGRWRNWRLRMTSWKQALCPPAHRLDPPAQLPSPRASLLWGLRHLDSQWPCTCPKVTAEGWVRVAAQVQSAVFIPTFMIINNLTSHISKEAICTGGDGWLWWDRGLTEGIFESRNPTLPLTGADSVHSNNEQNLLASLSGCLVYTSGLKPTQINCTSGLNAWGFRVQLY